LDEGLALFEQGGDPEDRRIVALVLLLMNHLLPEDGVADLENRLLVDDQRLDRTGFVVLAGALDRCLAI
jgi:hypothetical protein